MTDREREYHKPAKCCYSWLLTSPVLGRVPGAQAEDHLPPSRPSGWRVWPWPV